MDERAARILFREERAWRRQRKTTAPPGPSTTPPTDASRWAVKALTDECAILAAMAPNTGRNHQLNSSAFSLGQIVAGGALTETDVVAALMDAATTCGLVHDDGAAATMRSLHSGLEAGKRQPRTAPVNTDIPEIRPWQPTHADIDHDAFWDARDVLRHIHDFARARRVAPWALLGNVLTRVICAVPQDVVLPPVIGGDVSLNLFLLCVGPAGYGKDAAYHAAADAIEIHDEIPTLPVGSGEGISHAFVRRQPRSEGGQVVPVEDPRALFTAGEVDTLTAVGYGRRGATLLPMLRTAFTGGALGFQYGDPDKRLIVKQHQYRLCLIVHGQPARCGVLLDDATGGTPQRFLWLSAIDTEMPTDRPREPPRWPWRNPWTRGRQPFNSAARPGDVPRRYVRLPDAVTAELDATHVAKHHGDTDQLNTHASLTREKVAVALALLDDRAHVNTDDWQLAGDIMKVSDSVRAWVVEALRVEAGRVNRARGEADAVRTHVKDEKIHAREINRIARVLQRKLTTDWRKFSALRRDTTSRDRSKVKEALDTLLEAGHVERQGHGHSLAYRLRDDVRQPFHSVD